MERRQSDDVRVRDNKKEQEEEEEGKTSRGRESKEVERGRYCEVMDTAKIQ